MSEISAHSFHCVLHGFLPSPSFFVSMAVLRLCLQLWLAGCLFSILRLQYPTNPEEFFVSPFSPLGTKEAVFFSGHTRKESLTCRIFSLAELLSKEGTFKNLFIEV